MRVIWARLGTRTAQFSSRGTLRIRGGSLSVGSRRGKTFVSLQHGRRAGDERVCQAEPPQVGCRCSRMLIVTSARRGADHPDAPGPVTQQMFPPRST